MVSFQYDAIKSSTNSHNKFPIDLLKFIYRKKYTNNYLTVCNRIRWQIFVICVAAISSEVFIIWNVRVISGIFHGIQCNFRFIFRGDKQTISIHTHFCFIFIVRHCIMIGFFPPFDGVNVIKANVFVRLIVHCFNGVSFYVFYLSMNCISIFLCVVYDFCPNDELNSRIFWFLNKFN